MRSIFELCDVTDRFLRRRLDHRGPPSGQPWKRYFTEVMPGMIATTIFPYRSQTFGGNALCLRESVELERVVPRRPGSKRSR